MNDRDQAKADQIFSAQQQALRQAANLIYGLEDEVAIARLDRRLRALGVDPDSRRLRKRRRRPAATVALTSADVDLLVGRTLPNQ